MGLKFQKKNLLALKIKQSFILLIYFHITRFGKSWDVTPSVGNFINHSMSVALFTSQLLSQIKSGTLVMLVYGRETVLQVVHNRGHGFQKVLPCRGAQIATHTRSTSEKPNQNPTRPSRQSNHRIQKYFRGPPH